ncbi:response regulator receiver domain [Hymenobacter lapidiphilus]|uniref:Response receiver domain-containing protein n=1 Tax=Hymenobacter lapidiphilus TaxID=2608003 RepID=A0A7Y7PSA6_9BACT|nr:response regulator receiver domain [Hymenobacter lapidiphilus]NVO33099.1 hypothetical protein [Hymenobacter lapidiphilus]
MSPEVAYEEFHAYSRNIATNFLQSVVVVDDKAETTFTKKEPIPEPVPGLVQPGRAGKQITVASRNQAEDSADKNHPEQGLSLSTTQQEHVAPAPQPVDTEVLPIKALNEAFARHGIVCGFLSPTDTGSNRETIIEAVERSAKRADIVILDWKMEGRDEGRQDGYTALKIIEHILKSDEKGDNSFQSSGRLRLIAIYSQSPDLAVIINNIQTHTKENSHSFEKLGDFALQHESTHICAFRKAGGTVKDERTLDVNSLTDKLIDEFTLLTEGLLSNVAIEALSALRLNTHKILQKFNPELDAPYLTHRALTNPSDETMSHPIAMLASEMQDVLEGNGVTNSVSPERIRNWLYSLPHRILPGLMTVNPSFGNITVEQQLELVIDAVINGVSETPESNVGGEKWLALLKKMQSPKKDESSTFTNLMLADGTGALKDRKFSILTTVRSHYTTPPPYLNLGTVVALRNGTVSEYYVCIQPICDCVRLECARRFPFLKLELPPVAEPGKPKPSKFDFIVKDGEKLLELKVNYKPYHMELFSFAPVGTGKLVEAVPKEKQTVPTQWLFKGIDGRGQAIECFWIADLKFAHAQRIAERFGSEITRVGLTESEWLRRMAV